MSRSLDLLYSGTNTPSGLQTDCDYLLVIKTFEQQIIAWLHEWTNARAVITSECFPYAVFLSHCLVATVGDEVLKDYASTMMTFYFHYYSLVIHSFGLQNAIERSAVDIPYFFSKCHTSATAVAVIARDELAPRGFLRYSPDSHFVFLSYAVLSLLKVNGCTKKVVMLSE